MFKFNLFKIFILIFIILIILFFWFFDIIQLSTIIEINIPFFCQKECKDNYSKEYLYDEALWKIYLTENQSKKIENKINKNKHWKKTAIDENLQNIIIKYSRGIYNEIYKIKNYYWFYLNRCYEATDIYTPEEEKYGVCAFSLALLDLDTKILYYYTMDR